jgi:hypothetical protein
MIAAIPLSDKVRGERAHPDSPASAEYSKRAQTRGDPRANAKPVPQNKRPSSQGLLGRVKPPGGACNELTRRPGNRIEPP